MNDPAVAADLEAARRARREGRPEEAARLFAAVVARVGDHPVALNGLGLDALAGGRAVDAAAFFRRAIAADPASPELRLNLARALRQQDDVAGEREALEGVLALDRRHFMALVRLAELLERTGDVKGAAEQWSAVLAIGAMLEERSPAIDEIIARARTAVERSRADFAATLDAGLAAARESVPPEERRRFEACLDHVLGRRQIYANQCAGLHFPFLPAEEFFPRHQFPWLAEIEAQTDTIRAELEAILAAEDGGIRPYVAMEPGTPANKWTPLDNSLAWGALHLWKDGRRDPQACARAPRTAAAIEALPLSDLPGRTPTVFFSLLQPGAHLPAHTGVSNVRTIVHLPLIVPEGCALRVGGETRPWRVGEAFAFDDTIEHEAWNRSDSLRAVLIFDVWNPYLSEAERDLLRQFYTIANASDHADADTVSVG